MNTKTIILALAISASSNLIIAQDAPPPRPPIPSRLLLRAYDHNAKTGATTIQISPLDKGGKTVFVEMGQQVPLTDWKFESFELKDKGEKDESVAKMVNVKTGQSLALVVGLMGGDRPSGDQSRGDRPQEDRPPGEGRPGAQSGQGFRPVSPIIEALDINKDGTIDAEELAKAAESLKKLDKNGDGKITEEEFRPQRPAGQGGPGGEGRQPGAPGAAPGGRGEGRPPGGGQAAPGGEGRPQRPELEK